MSSRSVDQGPGAPVVGGLAQLLEEAVEGPAPGQGHDVAWPRGVVGGRLEDGADAGVLQAGSDADLAFEALHLFVVAGVDLEDLHRHVAVEMLITRLPHPARGAVPDLVVQPPTSGDQLTGLRKRVDLLTGHALVTLRPRRRDATIRPLPRNDWNSWCRTRRQCQGLRPYGPYVPTPRALSWLGSVASSGTVGGWASPIVSAHHHSAPVLAALRPGRCPGPNPQAYFNTGLGWSLICSRHWAMAASSMATSLSSPARYR